MSSLSDIKYLKGKRVNLRPVLEEDLPLLTKWINDTEVNRFIGRYTPATEEDEREWLSSLSGQVPPSKVVFMIVVDGSPIGNMGIHGINFKDRYATTGAMIGEKDYWEQGYGTEAMMLLLNYAFNTLNLRKICAAVYDFNERSLAFCKKCGYKKEGVRKKQTFRNGRYCDEILFAVFKEDWIPEWEKYKEKYGL